MKAWKDKVVLITGSSSGIGVATAEEFAKLGAKLVVTGLVQADVDKVVKRCEELGASKVESLVTDLHKDEDIQALVDLTLQKFGTLDVLVNNAGAFSQENLQQAKGNASEMDTHYRLFLRAPWKLSGFFVDELIKNKGCIVNVSSCVGIIPIPSTASYCIMKAGLMHMTKCMATELGMQGVRVNCVAPGSVCTNFLEGIGVTEDQKQKTFDEISSSLHVLEQKVLIPEDVAKSIIFLASDAARRITGVILPVDGGAILSSPAYDFAGSQSIPGLEQDK